MAVNHLRVPGGNDPQSTEAHGGHATQTRSAALRCNRYVIRRLPTISQFHGLGHPVPVRNLPNSTLTVL
jgi:hypothetical protein